MPVVVGYFVPIAIVVALFLIFKVQRPPLPSFESPKTESRMALSLFVLFAAIVIASTAISAPARDMLNLPRESKIRSLAVWFLLLLPFVVILSSRRQRLDTCFFPTERFWFHMLVSIAMGFASILVYALSIGKVQMLPSVLSNLFTISSLFLLIPIVLEEFVFRGFLLARLTAGFGQHKGVLLSAVLFGVVHYPRYIASSELSFLQITQTVILIIAVSIGGGYAIYSIRCMFYGVFIHWCMNIAQFSISTS
ncbi:MAG: hypothetical protein IGBAC_0468 [Ignavibacteriae bacterium]|nr:MAG: hypothetical protein IGBAC_0468 [Ignavibacteriota bacterium]